MSNGMLVTRQDLTFDFRGAKWDLNSEADCKLLGWVFNQFLYGEVTGIQCGYWLYRAPSLNAAAFLARQAAEEISHAKRFVKILALIGEKPGPAHGGVRFLSTGMMGGTWGEHVFLEMSLGEGLVLSVLYVLADTIESPEILKILDASIPEEERHVEFGERETLRWLKDHPRDRRFLLAQACLQVLAMRWIRSFVLKSLARQVPAGHPILSRFPDLYEHILRTYETRIQRLGVSLIPISQMSGFIRMILIAGIPFQKVIRWFRKSAPLLTKTYLRDAAVTDSKNTSAPGEI